MRIFIQTITVLAIAQNIKLCLVTDRKYKLEFITCLWYSRKMAEDAPKEWTMGMGVNIDSSFIFNRKFITPTLVTEPHFILLLFTLPVVIAPCRGLFNIILVLQLLYTQYFYSSTSSQPICVSFSLLDLSFLRNVS